MGDSECVEGCVDGGEYVVTVSTGEGNCIVKTSSSGEYCTFFSFTYRCAAYPRWPARISWPLGAAMKNRAPELAPCRWYIWYIEPQHAMGRFSDNLGASRLMRVSRLTVRL